jgi:hypothetical protein
MSAERRVAALSLLSSALLLWLTVPCPAVAHAIGGTFQLPVPRAIYLGSAALVVGASFVVALLVVRRDDALSRYPVLPLAAWPSRAASLLITLLGMMWWAWALLTAFVSGDTSSVPGVLVWIVAWVGMPIIAIVLGNPWPSFSPFRTLFGVLQAGGRAIGVRRLDLGMPYPPRLARWPAVGLLFAAIWAELVLPGSSNASTVGLLLAGYTLVTTGGMLVFGRIAWLRHAELFEVLLGWFGRIGPAGRRTTDPAICEGCAERCDPQRCVECPECAVVAEPGERSVELRPWFAGLTEVPGSGWSDAAFILLVLAGVTFDGLHETSVWQGFLQFVGEPLVGLIGAGDADLVTGTLGLLLTWLGFFVVFAVAVSLAQRNSGFGRQGSFGTLAGDYAVTLLPIAAGYFIAHYLTLLIQGVVWLPELVANPSSSVAPTLDWIPIAFVWYLSVGAIVLGHVVAIVLAHRLALRDRPRSRWKAGLPLVLVMIGYTVLSLWIIAQPITANPG